MKRLLVLALLLCSPAWAIKPAQRAAQHAAYYSEAAGDRFINRNAKPTLWLDGSKPSTVTQTANAVGTWASRVGSITFTQGTAANKPTWTRPDNLENRVADSGGLGATAGGPVRATWSDPVLTEDNTAGSSHYWQTLAQVIVPGRRYKECARVKLKERHASLRFDASAGFDAGYAHFNLTTGALNSTTGTVGNATITADGDHYIICAQETATAVGSAYLGVYMASTPATIAYNGDSASGLYIDWISFQDIAADPQYLPTTTAPQYRGIGGRNAVYFNGSASQMTSTATLADVFGASAKSIFAVVRDDYVAVGNNPRIFTDSASKSVLYVTGTSSTFFNDDGAADTISSTVASGGKYLFAATHDGTNLTFSQNGASVTPVASGVTSALTGTLKIGATGSAAQYLAGPIGELITTNTALPQSTIRRVERCLARKWGIDLQ